MRNISFDIVAVLIFVLLIISVIARKMTVSRTNKLFLVAMCVGLATTLCDIFANYMDSVPDLCTGTVCEVFHMSYLLFYNLHGPLFVMFTVSLLDMWHKLMENNVFAVLFSLPFTAVAVMLITNPFSHFVLSVENGGYTHEQFFNIVYISGAIYFINCRAQKRYKNADDCAVFCRCAVRYCHGNSHILQKSAA